MALRTLTIAKLEGTPWATLYKPGAGRFKFLGRTMVPEIGFRLLSEDMKTFFHDKFALYEAVLVEIMHITAKFRYETVHVQLDYE